MLMVLLLLPLQRSHASANCTSIYLTCSIHKLECETPQRSIHKGSMITAKNSCCVTVLHSHPRESADGRPDGINTYQLTAPSQLASMAMNARLRDLSSDPSWPAVAHNVTMTPDDTCC